MPKLKTRKGVAKRFKLNKKGKVTYRPGSTGHLLSSKKPKRLRKIRRAQTLSDRKNIKYLKRMLPYG